MKDTTSMKTPLGRIFRKRYVGSFNPYAPSKELMEVLSESHMPKSSYLNKNTRGKFLTELDLFQLQWIGFELENGSEEIKLLAKMLFFIELAKDESITPKEIAGDMKSSFGETYGNMIATNIKHHFENDDEGEW